MKINKSKLRKIIKEEISKIGEIELPGAPDQAAGADDSAQQSGDKELSDVAAISQRLARINNAAEYTSLLSVILGHAKNIPTGEVILRKAVQSIKKILRGS